MEGQMGELRSLAGRPKGSKHGTSRPKADGRRPLEWALAFVERDIALWNEIFLAEANLVARFLGLLADLQLDVTSELEELKSLKSKNEFVLQQMSELTHRVRDAAHSGRIAESQEYPNAYHELMAVSESVKKLKARVEERAQDAVRLVSLMTPVVDSQTLVDLFTGEP